MKSNNSMPLIDIVLLIILAAIIFLTLGYGLRLHHENQIRDRYNSQAEQDLGKLEEQFHESWQKKYGFNIFNGQYRVWPLKNDKGEKRFSYAGASDEHEEALR